MTGDIVANSPVVVTLVALALSGSVSVFVIVEFIKKVIHPKQSENVITIVALASFCYVAMALLLKSLETGQLGEVFKDIPILIRYALLFLFVFASSIGINEGIKKTGTR